MIGEDKIKEFEEIVGVRIDIFEAYHKKYNEYKARAKHKKLTFNLSFNQFYLAVTSGCYICNLDGTKNIIGLDRLNNKKGYTFYNISGCCWTCNRMKSDMTITQLKDHLRQIKPNHPFVTENYEDILK